MIKDIQLDHIAIAVESWQDGWPTLLGELYAKWRSGGMQPGFQPSQYAFENEMKIELIAPYLIEQNDFLKRFIDKSGTGPHHMTFKVKDINSALDEAESLGFTIVSKNTENDWWKEAFLHPKETCGIVIQLAQAAGTWFVPPPEDILTVEGNSKSELKYICYAVKDHATATKVFMELLGGTLLLQGKLSFGDLGYSLLSWPGPGRILLIYPSFDTHSSESNMILDKFLGPRLGRVNYLYLEIDNSSGQTGTPVSLYNDSDLFVDEILISEMNELSPAKHLTVLSETNGFNVRSVINYVG